MELIGTLEAHYSPISRAPCLSLWFRLGTVCSEYRGLNNYQYYLGGVPY